MKNKSAIFMLIAHLVTLSLISILLISSFAYKIPGPDLSNILYLSDVKASIDGGEFEQISLPHSFKNLKARTPVVIESEFKANFDDIVLIKTVYSPAKVYLDGKLVHQFGVKEDYPAYMEDPATEFHMIETHGKGEFIKIRIELLSPSSRNSMSFEPPMIGNSKELILSKQKELGISSIFSLIQIIGGFSLVFIALSISLINKKGFIFMWVGFFSLLTGIWAFGENNFSGMIFKNASFLYLMAFIGLFTFIIPLLRFLRLIIDFKNPKPLWCMEIFFAIASSIAMLLQLTGVLMLSKSMYFFHLTLPIALILTTVLVIREFVKYDNVHAKRLIFPTVLLSFTALLELVNYVVRFTNAFSVIFQAGILLFLLYIGFAVGFSLKDSFNLQEKEKTLAFEKNLINVQIEEQKRHSELLMQNEELISQQRHDLRHQLTYLRELTDNNNTKLINYLDSLIKNIPAKPKMYCENAAVNAIVAHYATVCENYGIEFSVRLTVPKTQESETEGRLCAIFGNLLENAAEACNRMENGKRFIKIKSSMQYDMLAITMDNSCNGKIVMENNKFRSSKRDDYGIGIESIKSIAQKSDGNAEFNTDGKIFYSSVLMKI